jgi:predicted Zn-dependent protease
MASSRAARRARRRRLCAAVLLPLALAGACASAPPKPRPQVSAEERDVLRRQQQLNQVGAEYPFLWDPEVLEVLQSTGWQIAHAVGAAEGEQHYYVIDKPILNAFTSPTGDIFFFTGQLAAMHNRSELAGVLAHEIAHVRAGHYERISRSASLGTIPAVAAIILSGGNPAVMAGAMALLQSYQLSFSREMETEADRLSMLYLQQTDFDPRGLIGALQVIETGERLAPYGVPEQLRTHPLTSTRLAALADGLGLPPGEPYVPAPDPVWDRVRAIVLAIDEPARALREFGPRAASGAALDLDLLGVVYARHGDPVRAAAQFRLAVAAAPGEARYAIDLGVALWSLGDAAGARAELERALRLPGGSSNSLAHFVLGEVARSEGRADDALARYARAVELGPQLSEAHYQYALALSGTQRLGEADFHFGRAAALRGDYLGAVNSYRQAREKLGADPAWSARLDQALRHME